MSEQLSHYTFNEGAKIAEGEILYKFPEGVTSFELCPAAGAEKSRYGNWIITIKVGKQVRKTAISAGLYHQMAEAFAAGARSFQMARVGLTMDTRYKLIIETITKDMLDGKKKPSITHKTSE